MGHNVAAVMVPSSCRQLSGNTVLQISAVVAVGLVEGIRHVNWTMLVSMLKWWVLGFAAVVLCTAGLIAQGKLCQ